MYKAIVEIKKPCRENLEAMPDNDKGKFCGSCQTTVIDFTQMSPDEISAYFLNHKNEHICGTFDRNDVKTDSRIDHLLAWLHSRKLKFAAVFILGILLLSGCRSRRGGTRTAGTPVKMLDEKTQSIENLK